MTKRYTPRERINRATSLLLIIQNDLRKIEVDDAVIDTCLMAAKANLSCANGLLDFLSDQIVKREQEPQA